MKYSMLPYAQAAGCKWSNWHSEKARERLGQSESALNTRFHHNQFKASQQA